MRMSKSSIIGISLAVVLASAAMSLVLTEQKAFALTSSQNACVQRANAAFTTAVNAAIQQITTGTLTNNQALVRAGTTALNNAITAYNTAIAQCLASG
jgi:hypothetical protein